MSFVEVADARVSRLHCCIRLQPLAEPSLSLAPVVEDHSSNGTYVNRVRLQSGQGVMVQSGTTCCLWCAA